LIIIHIGAEVVIVVAVLAPAQFAIIESTPSIAFVVIASSSIRELIPQALAGIVLRMHKIEATLFIGTRLFSVRLDSGPHLKDGFGMGREELGGA
jgi:hypothetical protein